MITMRRANQSHPLRRGKRNVWFKFNPQDRAHPLAEGFGALAALDEGWLPPGARVAFHPARDAEILTYVLEGELAQEDPVNRRTVVIQAGEFQCLSAGRASRFSERNGSRIDWTRVFRISLHPAETGHEASRQQKRFSAAERHGVLCVVASPDGRKGSLRIRPDARIYSAMLDRGQHLIHELSSGRRAWLHMVHGEVSLGNSILATGDAVGFMAERTVSFTARETAEILLLDLGERSPAPDPSERAPKSAASTEGDDISSLEVWGVDRRS